MAVDAASPNRERTTVSGVKPTVIGEADHPIRLGDIDREALKVLYRLRDAGFSGYLVGGGVRDLYLGKQPKDFDISTNARPGQLRRLFRNSRTIGRRFRLVQVFFRGNKIIEVSTLRSQSEHDIRDTKVLPSNNTFGTLEEDAFRRDLTINSLFYEIENNTIIDYVGGVDDLNRGIIRIVGNPDVRITRDPVRMLRAVRHAARTGFSIEEQTWKAIIAHRDKLNLCPPSRIRDELFKDLVAGHSKMWAEKCIQSRIFFTLFPFYEPLLTEKEKKHQLYRSFAVIDRLHNGTEDGSLRLPEHILLAAILYPWMERECNLHGRELKGGGYPRLLNDVRTALEEVVCKRFSIKRLVKEAMTVLFVNMPNMRQYGKKEWPKWLRKKSYFNDCVKFSALVEEARGGASVSIDLFPVLGEGQDEILSGRRNGSGRRGHRGGNPAFTTQKGGVFGLGYKPLG